jgi:hypothetical protein
LELSRFFWPAGWLPGHNAAFTEAAKSLPLNSGRARLFVSGDKRLKLAQPPSSAGLRLEWAAKSRNQQGAHRDTMFRIHPQSVSTT